MKRSGRNLDQHTARSLLDLRCYLERPAMELLAAHHMERDIDTLKQLRRRAALSVEGKTEISFAEVLCQYHRTLMKLSSNTITPLIMNALSTSALPFWFDYEALSGVESALR